MAGRDGEPAKRLKPKTTGHIHYYRKAKKKVQILQNTLIQTLIT
jgi:hypothetical protein